MADDLGERTEEPTPKRREEARDEGNVARSLDLTGAIMLAVATLAIWAAAMPMLESASVILGHALDGPALADPLDPHETWRAVVFVSAAAVRLMAPVLLVVWTAAALAQIGQVGWLFAPKAVAPSLGKLNPGRGFRRIFGLSGLVKAAIDSLKVLVVVAVAVLTVMQHAERIVLLPYLPLLQVLAETGQMLLTLALRVVAVLL
ncbi:MAG: EscU/YscU/HrcU family type III secretion system export apparatus switch protein, partial [Planctomycetota bacterium]